MECIVKTEPTEVNEEDVDDDFINRCMEDGGEEEKTGAKKRAIEKRSTRSRTTKIKVILRMDEDNSEEEEPDDWKPGGVRKGTPKGKRKDQKQSAEERRQRNKERMRKLREKQKQEEARGAAVEVGGGRPKRSSAKLRVSSGNNVEDSDTKDGDWAPENDDEEEEQEEKPKTPKSSRKRSSGAGGSSADRNARRRVSNLTPEQAEALRQKKRDYRLRLKLMREQPGGGETEGIASADASQIIEEVDGTSSKRASEFVGGGRRKKVSEMTEEEKELIRLKWREEARQRRAARQTTTPATGGKREVLDIEEIRRRDRERQRRKRAAKTPEERQEENRRLVLVRIMKRAAMTEEELHEERQRNYFKRQAKLAMMSEEERHALREKRREYNKPYVNNRYAKLLEKVGPEALREKRRKAWREMNPLKKQQHLDQCREYYKRKMERIKADPLKHAEMLKSYRERRLRRKKGNVLRTVNRQRKPKTLTPEQEVKIELRRVLDKKKRLENKLERWKIFFESGGEEVHRQLEAAPERQRECIRKRIAKAKANLRARLEASGASAEEISQRLQELESTFTTDIGYRPYKPRTEGNNPVGPGGIAKLESDIQELGRLAGMLAEGQKVESPLLPPAIPARPRLQKRESGTTHNWDIPPSPRKRGRPSKQPQPSTSSSAITQRTPAVKPSAAETPKKMGQMNPPPASFLQPHQYQLPYTTSGIYSTQSAFPYNPHQSISNVTPSLQQDLESISYQGISTVATGAHQVPGHQNTGYEASVSSSEHDDHYASSSYFDDDAPLSPGGNYDNYSDSSYLNQGQQPEQPSYSQPVVTKVESAQPTSSFPFQSWAGSSFPLGSGSFGVTPRGTGSVGKRGRPKGSVGKPKSDKPRAEKPHTPESKMAKVICEECGGYFHPFNLRSHKNEVHNPNFDRANKKCRLCGEHFSRGRNWYSHYMNQHVRPAQPVQERPCVCEQCGQTFTSRGNLSTHVYYMHGEGTNPNNFIKCDKCPPEVKGFKTRAAYNKHLRRCHPEIKELGHECFRCEENFVSDKQLNGHVAGAHPDSYFPCPYCKRCRFTEMGLHFHFVRCQKIGNAERKRLKEEWTGGLYSVEMWPIQCEFCKNHVTVASLGRHFKEQHNVTEDQFTCEVCKKVFKSRPFWVSHLEERHQKSLEEMKAYVGNLNAKNREGLCAEPKKFLLGRNSRKNMESQGIAIKRFRVYKKRGKMREGEEETPEKVTKKKEPKMRKRQREERTLEVTRRKRPKLKKQKRKIRVVCEEDELEADMREGHARVKIEVCESEEDSE